jgi:hypothetical protein
VRYTLTAAISDSGVLAHDITPGSMTSERLVWWVETHLLPVMNPFDDRNPQHNSVLILDNCSTHHTPEFKAMLARSGIRVEYLPAYSPTLNPIEEVFHDWKQWMRTNTVWVQSCKCPLWAMEKALFSLSLEQIQAHITQAGYE